MNDVARVRSLISAIELDLKYVQKQEINEESSTVIFKLMYDVLRQTGDALLLSEDRKPLDHVMSMERLSQVILPDCDLHEIDRFRNIRNDIQYQGFRVSFATSQRFVAFCLSVIPQILLLIDRR